MQLRFIRVATQMQTIVFVQNKSFWIRLLLLVLHISFRATKVSVVQKDLNYEFNNVFFLSIDILISYNVD